MVGISHKCYGITRTFSDVKNPQDCQPTIQSGFATMVQVSCNSTCYSNIMKNQQLEWLM